MTAPSQRLAVQCEADLGNLCTTPPVAAAAGTGRLRRCTPARGFATASLRRCASHPTRPRPAWLGPGLCRGSLARAKAKGRASGGSSTSIEVDALRRDGEEVRGIAAASAVKSLRAQRDMIGKADILARAQECTPRSSGGTSADLVDHGADWLGGAATPPERPLQLLSCLVCETLLASARNSPRLPARVG